MDSRPRSVTSPPSLCREIARRFYATLGDPNTAVVDVFAAYFEAELARNPVALTGYCDAGLTVTLADGVVCLLSPPAATAPPRPETDSDGPYERDVVRITGTRR